MSIPNEIMSSLSSSSMTNARGSGDGGNDYGGFLASSLFFSSLDIAPSTDNFYSGKGRALLRTILALYSRGPVGFGDAVGEFNATLLKRTARSDGILLQPSETAVQLDSPGYCATQCNSLILMTTVSRISNLVFSMILALVDNSKTNTAPVRFAEMPELNRSNTHYVWRLDDPNCVPGGAAQECLKLFDEAHNATITSDDASVFVISPELPSGLIVLGEISKLNPLSPARITNISTEAIYLQGAPKEKVDLVIAKSATHTISMLTTVLSSDGVGKVAFLKER
eukprot:m.20501 g.20501  ORF g.20501 m.20501 type:complete len:282 (-) comp6863_c0_seq1:97-942(-)